MVTLFRNHVDRARHRARVLQWRVRYWWLDTESGGQAQVMLFCVSLLVALAQLLRMAVAALQPAPAVGEQKAVVWWVVQLIIALVAAIMSYALRPKIPKTPPPQVKGPSVEDGLCVDDHFGEVRITDEHVLAWKVVKTEKIKSKAGKK